MALTHFKGTPVHLTGPLPSLNSPAPDFVLVDKTLKNYTLSSLPSTHKILATVPSLDTATCSLMTKHLNDYAKAHPAISIITVSADLPFAQKRFCEAEKVQNVLTLSMMRDKAFGAAFGILIKDGPLQGLLARALFLLSPQNTLLHIELAPEITQEPNYQKIFTMIESN